MMTIYMVSYGSYSDYTVVGAFSTKELAQEFINSRKKLSWIYSDAQIEEYEVDKKINELTIFGVSEHYDRWHSWFCEDNNHELNKVIEGINTYSIYIVAKDEKEALKKGHDLIMQWKATFNR